MNRTMRTTAAAALLLLAAEAARAQDFRWEGNLPAGRTIEVVGVDGDIRAIHAAGGTALVTAEKAGRGDHERVTIDVVETGSGVRICAVYPQKRGGTSNPCRDGDGHRDTDDVDVTVDFTVHVPTGVELIARTVNGGIEAEGLRGDVHAATVNGGIQASATGLVEASTVNGDIDAASGRGRWEGTLDFITVNGSIHLRLPADAGAEVDAGTVNGQLSSDFPLTIQANQNWGPRRMAGTIGGGGGRLRLETVNGAIEITRG